jgi:hypothetical protein
VLARTDLATRATTKGGVALGAMPTDGAAFAGGWVVRTTEAIVVVAADGTKEAHRVPIRSGATATEAAARSRAATTTGPTAGTRYRESTSRPARWLAFTRRKPRSLRRSRSR